MKKGTGHVVMSTRIRDYPTNFNQIRCLQSIQEVQITALGIWGLVVRSDGRPAGTIFNPEGRFRSSESLV